MPRRTDRIARATHVRERAGVLEGLRAAGQAPGVAASIGPHQPCRVSARALERVEDFAREPRDETSAMSRIHRGACELRRAAPAHRVTGAPSQSTGDAA